MKRIIPPDNYRGIPCSLVAIGCALNAPGHWAVKGTESLRFWRRGYLSLAQMDGLVRANLAVTRRRKFQRGERPMLREYAHENPTPAIICVEQHYLYFDGRDYYSFMLNGGDRVVCVWELETTKL